MVSLDRAAKLILRLRSHADWAQRQGVPKVASDLREAARMIDKLLIPARRADADQSSVASKINAGMRSNAELVARYTAAVSRSNAAEAKGEVSDG